MPGMPAAPDQFLIDSALDIAAQSPCRSKRGVVLYDPTTGAFRGASHNGPPRSLTCPGRATCAGTCDQRSVHAEVRALRAAEAYRLHHRPGPYDLVHVELAADGSVVACAGPRCWQCSREILDVGFVGGVWLYEGAGSPPRCGVYLGDNDATCPQSDVHPLARPCGRTRQPDRRS